MADRVVTNSSPWNGVLERNVRHYRELENLKVNVNDGAIRIYFSFAFVLSHSGSTAPLTINSCTHILSQDHSEMVAGASVLTAPAVSGIFANSLFSSRNRADSGVRSIT